MTDQAEPKKVTMILPAALHRALKVAAAEDGRTVTDIIEALVKDFLEKRTKGTEGEPGR